MVNQIYSQLLQEADLCVKCGQCLSSCPTYLLRANEAESPRGRISLIQGLLSGSLKPDSALKEHLDHCLGCGNCESLCPSGVNYLHLLDSTRATKQLNKIPSWQLSVFSSRRLAGISAASSNLLPESVLKLLPDIHHRAALNRPIATTEKVVFGAFPTEAPAGRVALFTGCAGAMIDASAINWCRKLLVHLGYDVIIPRQQACCGAIHRHEGYPDKADHYLQQNVDCFNALELDRVLYFASGCGSQLALNQANFNAPITEATVFLAGINAIKLMRVKTQNRIALHAPCSLKNQTNAWPLMLELLKTLAGDQLFELPGNALCCGSAGLHQLKYPETAAELLQPKLNALAQTQADILLTSNPGCAMHFSQGISRSINDNQPPTEVMHPVEWIARLYLADLN